MPNPPIIFEDGDILVINKPAGFLTHPVSEKETSKSIAGWAIKKYPQIKKVGDNPKLRPGIVHRLDKFTSGLLIIAKTQQSFEYFKKQFKERKIEKTYLALVYGKPAKTMDTVISPLGKIGIKQTVNLKGKKELKEKEAITRYKVLKTYKTEKGMYSLLEINPLTGRTHQIRIHTNSIGHPIVGDILYGAKKTKKDSVNLNRLFLHAYRLKLTTPSGKGLVLESELSQELKNIIATLEKKAV